MFFIPFVFVVFRSVHLTALHFFPRTWVCNAGLTALLPEKSRLATERGSRHPDL